LCELEASHRPKFGGKFKLEFIVKALEKLEILRIATPFLPLRRGGWLIGMLSPQGIILQGFFYLLLDLLGTPSGVDTG
jgi:hypothetical protein